jgi:ethanolamine transporter EutH
MSVIGIVVISVVMFCAVAGIMAAVPLLSQLVRALAGPMYAAAGADPVRTQRDRLSRLPD